ncbi:hypothetical protein UlMin_041139 [Ulmus minor]
MFSKQIQILNIFKISMENILEIALFGVVKPSSYLLYNLRNYVELHRCCGLNSKSYNEIVKQLKSGHIVDSFECKYVVWISFSGLGNRMITIASAFLYALLTNWDLLVDPRKNNDMADLFCEPFPKISWLLPPDFPIIRKFDKFNHKHRRSFGKMMKKNLLNASTKSLPSYLYLHLAHDYDDLDRIFFCDQEQNLLQKVPWLIMKTNNFFVPSLFLMPSFEDELSRLFPEKGTVFHHLGKYLFHPSNHVWGLIMRYYQAYLASEVELFQHVIDQILACTLEEKILPQVDKQSSITTVSGTTPKHKAVLITSLNSGHEGHQQTENKLHNRKAWAEMYLLSLTDVLVTSAWSTFGYVVQGLGGLKPWIMCKPPCFHAPPFHDCKAKKGVDTGALVPHLRHCADMSWGLSW